LGSEKNAYFGVTPAAYRKTGLAVEKIRQALGLKTIVFATPDIGGLALCCDNIRVVDLALLANHRLAAEGYVAMATVLKDENPDIIEVHEVWAALSNIYKLQDFQTHYVPIVVDSIRMFLRSDHIPKLFSGSRSKWCDLEEPECHASGLEKHFYKKTVLKADDLAFSALGKFILFE
jgi:hypothetical protein